MKLLSPYLLLVYSLLIKKGDHPLKCATSQNFANDSRQDPAQMRCLLQSESPQNFESDYAKLDKFS